MFKRKEINHERKRGYYRMTTHQTMKMWKRIEEEEEKKEHNMMEGGG